MIFSVNLKKVLFFSLLGHLMFLSAFSLTFGRIIPSRQLLPVSLWGNIISKAQVTPSKIFSAGYAPGNAAIAPAISSLGATDKDLLLLPQDLLKPQFSSLYARDKQTYAEKPIVREFALRIQEPTIVFHPLLPYGFSLYFKDRQTVHVELQFKVERVRQQNILFLKRKISSGNLEVDLLTMRYIEQYLFVQQASGAPLTSWQTIKIDLSAKE